MFISQKINFRDGPHKKTVAWIKQAKRYRFTTYVLSPYP